MWFTTMLRVFSPCRLGLESGSEVVRCLGLGFGANGSFRYYT